MAQRMDSIHEHSIPQRKGNLRLYKKYRTISLISHPSKMMLRVILNRLKGKAEQILAEEQAGLSAGRRTTDQIFNVIEKLLLHQKDLFHNFIDFKKAFDRIWHEGLWQVMRNEDLMQAIQAMYANSNIGVLLNNHPGGQEKTPWSARDDRAARETSGEITYTNGHIKTYRPRYHTRGQPTLCLNGTLTSVQLHPYERPAAPLRGSSCTPTSVQLHPYERPAAPLRASSCTPTRVQLHPYERPAAPLRASSCTPTSVQLHTYGRPAAPLRASSCTHTSVQLHPYERPAAHLRASSCTPTGIQLHPYERPAAPLRASSCTPTSVHVHPYERPAAPLRASSCSPTSVQLHPYERPAAPLLASSCTPTSVQLNG